MTSLKQALLFSAWLLSSTGTMAENIVHTQQELTPIVAWVPVFSSWENTSLDFLDIMRKPILKQLYQDLKKYTKSKESLKELQLSWKELQLLPMFFHQYANTKECMHIEKNIKRIFWMESSPDPITVSLTVDGKDAYWNEKDIIQEVNWFKLLIISVGQTPVICINYTQNYWPYSCWKIWDTPITLRKWADAKYFIEDMDRKQLSWRCIFVPSGNLLPVDENWNYDKSQPHLFWNYTFTKQFSWQITLALQNTPDAMLKDLYEHKKNLVGSYAMVRSLFNQWYVFQRNDGTKTVILTKDWKKSTSSASLLSYKDQNAFEAWLSDAQKEIDKVIALAEEEKKMFIEFKDKYCKWEFKDYLKIDYPRYKVRLDDINYISIIDTQKDNQVIASFSILHKTKGKEEKVLVSQEVVDTYISDYLIESAYLGFLTKHNKWQNAPKYYLSYPFYYNYNEKTYVLEFKRWSDTWRSQAVCITDQSSNTYLWYIVIKDSMTSNDIETLILKKLK